MPLEDLTPDQNLLYHWICERENARINKEAGFKKPWTHDKIIQQYRFCNVHRSDDKVTRWIVNNWCGPNYTSENMVLAMVAARTVNWPDTLDEIGFPNFQDAEGFATWRERARMRMKARRDRGEKVWTGAYLVSTNGHTMDKIDYILNMVWTPIYENFRWENFTESLSVFHKALMRFDGMGSFMAAQVVADLKYTWVLKDAPDWHTWSAIGPGSRRGLNRYFGDEYTKLDASIPEPLYHRYIAELRENIRTVLGMELHAQDVQNVLCEFDKYMRTLKGEGRPRSKYDGG